jgi:hypothetical protein
MNDKLTRAEQALIATLCSTVVERANRMFGDAGYPDSTERQQADVLAAISRLTAEEVIALRSDGPPPTLSQLGRLIELLAANALAEVLGGPPALPQGQLN